MHALPPDLESHGFATRWRAAAANLSLQGLVLAGAWTLYLLPFAFNDGARGGAMLLQASLPPATAAALLVASMALVEAGRPRGRVRTLAMVASAMAAAALSQVIVMAIMLGTGVWTAPPWPSPVLWWANFGATAMICLGAVLVEDHRVRGSERRAALREARLGSADVVRRTAEVNLQAARARANKSGASFRAASFNCGGVKSSRSCTRMSGLAARAAACACSSAPATKISERRKSAARTIIRPL